MPEQNRRVINCDSFDSLARTFFTIATFPRVQLYNHYAEYWSELMFSFFRQKNSHLLVGF